MLLKFREDCVGVQINFSWFVEDFGRNRDSDDDEETFFFFCSRMMRELQWHLCFTLSSGNYSTTHLAPGDMHACLIYFESS